MKREGRQHGMVLTYRFEQYSWGRNNTTPSSSSQAGPPFTRASQNPTNHSKFTGKCRWPRCGHCHTHPVEKSRYKAKGTHKLKCSDVLTNHRLVKWRVVDLRLALAPGSAGLKLTGSSAREILDHLATDDYYEEVDGDFSDHLGYGYDHEPDYDYGYEYGPDEFDGETDVDDDRMSFCDVGFIWEDVEGHGGRGGGWCLVEEI
ncbi:OLC1v1005504C1 [Oldenlandia corymbosa var. corymbosa]|uniref:OLC1v1005504C1 n=1 Tax=Oldenlandia corymbosa var. corymbosa TaxID=529605 RepID=A0AAV1DG14_OLDCO|nr:OLC1v1005504C1 [Oldenlandia corymbosa var. corymbosa]